MQDCAVSASLGFIGKNLENAEHLLREAQRRPPADAARLRAAAESIIGTFVVIDQSPPAAEGIRLNGSPMFYPTDDVCFLRPFTDDMNALLRAYQFEKTHGREHPSWLEHVRDFTDWLLTQQGADGSFPRSWNAGVGTVYDASKNMSGLAVPLLLRMARVTGDGRYQAAALRAGDASWQTFLDNDGHFVGSTPDRPNVLVHEASALAITTYADLYEATEDSRWLERARVAADINETWYVLWNVPAPLDAQDADLSVKRQVSTVGMDLCTSTNSGVDYYNSNDVDAYAKLYKWTDDGHYLDVARLLMHNTKSMMALPGRTFDLSGPGMQQEFWFLAPPRRQSWIREYTPWVTANQLHGIFLTEELDVDLYAKIVSF